MLVCNLIVYCGSLAYDAKGSKPSLSKLSKPLYLEFKPNWSEKNLVIPAPEKTCGM